GGKRRQIGLGSTINVSLERARELAREAREQVASGVDPKALREAAKVIPIPVEVVTFGSYALTVLDTKKADWHGRKTEPRWLNSINSHCAAILARPIGEIDTADVLAVLQPIWTTIPEGAEKTRTV